MSAKEKEEIICRCRMVSKKEIVHAIKKSASTAGEVGMITGAGTGCGRCKPMISSIIEKHTAPHPVGQLRIPFTFGKR